MPWKIACPNMTGLWLRWKTHGENLQAQALGINSQLEELRRLIEPAEQELEASQAQEGLLQKQETEEQAALARVERTNNQIQLELGHKQGGPGKPAPKNRG